MEGAGGGKKDGGVKGILEWIEGTLFFGLKKQGCHPFLGSARYLKLFCVCVQGVTSKK